MFSSVIISIWFLSSLNSKVIFLIGFRYSFGKVILKWYKATHIKALKTHFLRTSILVRFGLILVCFLLVPFVGRASSGFFSSSLLKSSIFSDADDENNSCSFWVFQKTKEMLVGITTNERFQINYQINFSILKMIRKMADKRQSWRTQICHKTYNKIQLIFPHR